MADERVPELVADLEDQAVACLMSVLPIKRQQAVEVSKKLSRHLTGNWGGQLIYFPKNLLGRVSERDMRIYKEFDGKNHAELARRYDLTVQHVYRIVKEVGMAERAKNQADLFS
ncbi:TPA: Mor transcription activator family protein [Neisseria meningitidis]|uniref:Mor transcription activator family protein n=1 Tax=Neisseria meningitidis TaxID=487 RepID=UPI0015D54BD6|nr:Mor transcription activator family protein [Neisseria meningitidis]